MTKAMQKKTLKFSKTLIDFLSTFLHLLVRAVPQVSLHCDRDINPVSVAQLLSFMVLLI